MLRRIYKSKAFRWFVLATLLSGCAGHPSLPEPTGKQVPVNADLWDYHGNEIFPVRNGN